MSRRIRFGVLVTGILVFLSIIFLSTGNSATRVPAENRHPYDSGSSSSGSTTTKSKAVEEPRFAADASSSDQFSLPADVLTGSVIAPKLENITIKRELGRASWRLFHTMMARFPDEPTEDESLALKTYIHLFARLYPCGDCAEHFQTVLAQYPPQTSSRTAAAGWACFVHNIVNKRLHRQEFDCTKIGDFYDCGCGDDEKTKKTAANTKTDKTKTSKSVERAVDEEAAAAEPHVETTAFGETEKEGLSRGG